MEFLCASGRRRDAVPDCIARVGGGPGPARPPGTERPVTTGYGLGLALVRVVAARHAGEAGLRERRDGLDGSEFYLRLPAAAHAATD